MSLFSLAVKGGIMMLPIFLCSLLAVYVVIERYVLLRSIHIDVGYFLANVREAFRKQHIAGVEALCAKTQASLAAILQRGIIKHQSGHYAIKEAIENAGREEIYRLEKHLNWLATIAGIAPMLGFLGTVTGMISVFQQIEARGANIVPSDLSGGIWEALITTAFGLMVGIPAYAFYNYFVSRVEKFVHELEITATESIDLLGESNGQVHEKNPAEHSFAPQPKRSPTSTIAYSPKKRTFGDDDFFTAQ
jgi:biopolymer transport protein ExbB